jgi:hypothetical protein
MMRGAMHGLTEFLSHERLISQSSHRVVTCFCVREFQGMPLLFIPNNSVEDVR